MTQPVTLRLARTPDAAPISTLLIANSVANGGSLFGEWSQAIVADWLATGAAVVVAQTPEGIKGVLFSAQNSPNAPAPVRAMFALCPADVHAPYAYGPICVDSQWRGRGLPGALFDTLQRHMNGRRGLLFIARDNPGSLKAHLRLGMSLVGEFALGDKTYDVLVTPKRPGASLQP